MHVDIRIQCIDKIFSWLLKLMVKYIACFLGKSHILQ